MPLSDISRTISHRHNLRDYGGLPTRSGGRIVSGRLYRSGELDHCERADADLLDRLAIGTIIDLRSPSEWPQGLPLALERYRGRVLRVQADGGAIPHSIGRFAGMQGREDVAAAMKATYLDLPFTPRFLEAMRLFFTGLAEEPAGSLIHCFAGKDRTGLAVALFHRLVDVHPDDMMEDYLRTNDMGEERIALATSGITGRLESPLAEDLLREVLEVRPDYLLCAMERIDTRHGGVRAYLAEAAGTDPATLDRVIAHYVREG